MIKNKLIEFKQPISVKKENVKKIYDICKKYKYDVLIEITNIKDKFILESIGEFNKLRDEDFYDLLSINFLLFRNKMNFGNIKIKSKMGSRIFRRADISIDANISIDEYKNDAGVIQELKDEFSKMANKNKLKEIGFVTWGLGLFIIFNVVIYILPFNYIKIYLRFLYKDEFLKFITLAVFGAIGFFVTEFFPYVNFTFDHKKKLYDKIKNLGTKLLIAVATIVIQVIVIWIGQFFTKN